MYDTVAMKPEKPGPQERVYCERYRLRRFVDALQQAGELQIEGGAADLAAVAPTLEGNERAVLFERVGPEGAQLVGNVMGSRARLARAFGVSPERLLPEVLRRLKLAPEVIEVPRAQAPAQEIVLTVPASFDDAARALTLEAAREAGLSMMRLLEEPQAALYDWLFRHRHTLADELTDTRLVLVCDIGGGTSDFSLVRVEMRDG